MMDRLLPRVGYPALTLSLILLLLLPSHLPMLLPQEASTETSGIFQVLFAVLMLAALLPIASSRLIVAGGLALAANVVLMDWVFDGPEHLLWRLFAYGVFILYIGSHLLLALVRVRRVDSEAICAAVCFYLMTGLNWGFLYAILELAVPGSFNLSHTGDSAAVIQQLIYFSFVTMATLGYGDIAPLSEAARSWVVLQAVFGQFFIAIVVARLVSLQLAGCSVPALPDTQATAALRRSDEKEGQA
jgi:voltage-gated potassium channel